MGGRDLALGVATENPIVGGMEVATWELMSRQGLVSKGGRDLA